MWLIGVLWRPEVGVPGKIPAVGEAEGQLETFLGLGSRKLCGSKTKPFGNGDNSPAESGTQEDEPNLKALGPV